MIRSLLFTPSGEIKTISDEQIQSVLEQDHGFLWVDIDFESLESSKLFLKDVFKFHPLSIDDALQETHMPKVDIWDDYLYMVLRTVIQEQQDKFEISTPELDIFLGPNYLVTFHEFSIKSVEKIWDLCQKDSQYSSRSAAYLLYHITDEIASTIMLMVENLDNRIDKIEDEIFDNPKNETLEHIFSVKRAVLRLRRTLLPQREVFSKLALGDYPIVEEKDQAYFRNIYDHMVRLYEINESLRELIGGALDTYLSVVNNRMNDVMKTLTIITTLFMPLSFLTGFFGMNFFQAVIPLEVWTGKAVFTLILAGMIFIPLGMYAWMRRRAWM